ncbi:SufD family Fe-S cluster assembly protein [Thiotrichales bacterium 19S11-10]|nr:SufD family Fe-S cluster assembly protein [Thiotrichales bacterium 19S11-10]
MNLFNQENLPTRRHERWKYTDLSKLLGSIPFQLGEFENIKPTQDISQISLLQKDNSLVFINGIFNQELSSYDELAITLSEDNQALPINIDFNIHPMASAVVETSNPITVKINQSLNQPLSIIHYLTGESESFWVQSQLKVLITSNSHAVIEEIVITEQNHQKSCLNWLTVFELEESATLVYAVDESVNHFPMWEIHGLHVSQAKNSSFYFNQLAVTPNLHRKDIHVHLREPESSCHIYSGAFLKEQAHIDHHVIIEHKASNTQSNVQYKAIATGKSTFVCNPKAIVASDVTGISAKQNSANILIESTASVYSKPELEIYSDDVSCSHGATFGELDKQALYYMQTRGIAEKNAKNLLMNAFIQTVIDCFDVMQKEKASQSIAGLLSQNSILD